MFRITIKKRSTVHINETLEMPQQTTLSALRVFLRHTYCYFPIKYFFEMTDGTVIKKRAEKNVFVQDVGDQIYLNTRAYSAHAQKIKGLVYSIVNFNRRVM